MPASSVGNHSDRNIFQCLKNLGDNALLFGYEVAHNADDGLVAVYFHLTKFFQFLHNVQDIRFVINREGHGHFGSGDHVNRGFVSLKHFENGGEKTIGQKHAGRLHFDGRDIILSRHGFDVT